MNPKLICITLLLSFGMKVVSQAGSSTNCAGTGGSAGNVNTSADACSSTGVAATCFPGNAQVISKKRGVIKMSQL